MWWTMTCRSSSVELQAGHRSGKDRSFIVVTVSVEIEQPYKCPSDALGELRIKHVNMHSCIQRWWRHPGIKSNAADLSS